MGDRGRFWRWVGAAVAVGLAIRLAYILTDDRLLPGGDGFAYHFEALRVADGRGYTTWQPDSAGEELAHHAPGWVTVLGGWVALGGRSFVSQQLLGAAFGLVLIVLIALVGRRYVSPRVGVVSAFLAAIYPGFWLVEANLLAEPLGLVLLAGLLLGLAWFRDAPGVGRGVAVGALLGLLALVRSEQAALLVLVVGPTILLARTLSLQRRLVLLGAATATMVALLAPWAIFNQTRFEEPVLLSASGGFTLLAGNCEPYTFEGERVGFFDTRCSLRVIARNPDRDQSQNDPLFRSEALTNIEANASDLPRVALARYGRAAAVFRPTQTVGFVAKWMGTGTTPIWAWVISFWALLVLAIVGLRAARARGMWLLPLLGPVVLALVLIGVTYGEPRYHNPADLSIIVLAATGLVRLFPAMGRRPSQPTVTEPSEPAEAVTVDR